MFKLIKNVIVLALLVGIVVLGVKIHRKASETGSSLTQEAGKIGKKIKQLAEDAVKETEELQKAYGNSPGLVAEKNGFEHSSNIEDETSPSPSLSLPSKIAKKGTKPALKPIDEEDRVLTEEILSEGSGGTKKANEPLEINRIYAKASIAATKQAEEEAMEPLDLDRLTEVRNIYLKALEILDLD